MQAFLSSSTCLENVYLCQCCKQFQSKPLTSVIKILCSSLLKNSENSCRTGAVSVRLTLRSFLGQRPKRLGFVTQRYQRFLQLFAVESRLFISAARIALSASLIMNPDHDSFMADWMMCLCSFEPARSTIYYEVRS